MKQIMFIFYLILLLPAIIVVGLFDGFIMFSEIYWKEGDEL